MGTPRVGPIRVSVDDKFTELQKRQISTAFKTWRRASGERVSFVVKWDQKEPSSYADHHKLNRNSGIFIWSIDKEKDIPKKLAESWSNYLGVTIYGPGQNSTNVIMFTSANTDEYFYPVVLHEIGHLIGMSHIPGIPSVMKPEVSVGCISQLDARQLCDLYNCTPRPECLILEQQDYITSRYSSAVSLPAF